MGTRRPSCYYQNPLAQYGETLIVENCNVRHLAVHYSVHYSVYYSVRHLAVHYSVHHNDAQIL